MLISLAFIVLLALALNYIFRMLGFPGLIGMILTGILLGSSVLNLIDGKVLELLSEFKTVALIVILIRAGLGIHRDTLNKIGGSAIRMSFIPGTIEGLSIMVAAHFLLGFSWIEGGLLGFIFAAVSPAVVVPAMLNLKDNRFGKKKEIPTLVLAGASADDVFAITIFGVFIGLASGNAVDIPYLLFTVPAGILAGTLIGAGLGYLLMLYFRKVHIRDTKKVIIFMVVSILFYEFTEIPTIKQNIQIAGLLGIMAIGFVLLEKYPLVAGRLAIKFDKVWVLAEILLFVYIGTSIDITALSGKVLLTGLVILLLGLLFRSLGVWLSLLRSNLNGNEKIFCMIAYVPKATVQAAIGAVPLSLIQSGTITSVTEATGQAILSLAVLSIVVTAPLGAIGINYSGPRLLSKD